MLNVISVDLEDYFHPTEVQAYAEPKAWDTLPSRIEDSTRRVLDLMARSEVRATFFVLGWVAQHHPRLIRDIAEAGHEIACHSYCHGLIFNMTPQQFREDTHKAVTVIADACGVTPRAYRAPSYSITEKSMWALDVLAELGFTHDSSIYPVSHDRYGIPGFHRHAQIMKTASGPILEIPVASVQLSAGQVAPVGGGAYLRLLPYRYTAAGIRRINREETQPACIYFHPWELDPQQPKLAQGTIARLRTYSGLSSMEGKLDRLFREFDFSTLTEVHPA